MEPATAAILYAGIKLFIAALTAIVVLAPLWRSDDTCIADAQAKYGIDTDRYINIAFAGHAKTGKSTLINAIRGLKNTDPYSAKTDTLEATQKVKYYQFHQEELQKVRLYDLPGCGTLNHTVEGYNVDKGLCGFDVLVVLVQDTIGTEELDLAAYAEQYIKHPVIFVRSKMDISFENAIKMEDDYANANQKNANDFIQKIYGGFNGPIEKSKLKRTKLFCVSGVTLRKYINGEHVDYYFKEKEFVNHLISMIQSSRNSGCQPSPKLGLQLFFFSLFFIFLM